MIRNPEFSSKPFNPNAIEVAGALQAIYNSVEHADFALEIQQDEAIEAIGHALVDGKTSGYCEMATSTGKTLIESLITQAAVAAGKRVLILAPKVSIASQIDGRNQTEPSGLARFTDVHQKTSVGLHFGGSQANARHQVVISTYPGFLYDAQQNHCKLGEFDVVVGDECHRGLGEKTAEALTSSFPDAIKMGFSATPDFAVDRTSEEIFGERLYEFSLMDAIEMGKTAPIRALVFETNEELSLYDNRQEFTERELAPLIENMQRNGTAIKLARDFIRDGRQGFIRAIPGYGNLHARILAEQLSKIQGITAAAIGSHLSREEQDWLWREFNDGKIDCLTSTRALGEGLDSNRPSFAINTAPSASPVETKQFMGRIFRKNPDGRESIYVDFVDRSSGDVAKEQYTALHALGLEVADSSRILGRYDQVAGSRTPPQELPAISDELLAKILASDGKLISEITASTTHHIPRRVLRHWEKVLAKEGMPDKLPDNITFDRALAKKFELGQIAAFEALGREPELHEIIDRIPTLNPHHRRVLARYGLQLSLEATGGDLETLADPLGEVSRFIEEEQTRANLYEVLKTISEKEETVIKARFGLGYDNPMTLDEVGALKGVGVTRERVRQIESNAMTKLRHPSRTRWLEMGREPDEPAMTEKKSDNPTTAKVPASNQHRRNEVYQHAIHTLRLVYNEQEPEDLQELPLNEISELFVVPNHQLSEGQQVNELLSLFRRLREDAEIRQLRDPYKHGSPIAKRYELAISMLKRLQTSTRIALTSAQSPESQDIELEKPIALEMAPVKTERDEASHTESSATENREDVSTTTRITLEEAAELSGWGRTNLRGFQQGLKEQGVEITTDQIDGKTVKLVERSYFGF